MSRNWISYRQAGMIVNALHGRDRYGRKLRPKSVKVTQVKPIEPVSAFFVLLFWIFVLAILFPSWKVILPLIILALVVVVSLIFEENKRVEDGRKQKLNYKNEKPLIPEINKRKTITLCHKNGIAFELNKKAPFTGIYEEYYKNGNKKYEISYVDGKQNGLFIRWYENGLKSMEGFYNAKGNKNGLATSWYRNGQKWSEINFEDGIKSGLAMSWNQNGTTKNITH